MTLPWHTIEKVDTRDGVLELRQRGKRDFLILINNRVLMNSSASRSEIALGESACKAVRERPGPRVLIGGLGMGLTLRAALDCLPARAKLVVAELNPVVIDWCRGPLATLTKSAVKDPRVVTVSRDVSVVIREAARHGSSQFDAIILDLYEGPHSGTDPRHDPFYGTGALNKVSAALTAGGVLAVWGENPDKAFEGRLAAAGFSVIMARPGKGGLRHATYIAKKLVKARDAFLKEAQTV